MRCQFNKCKIFQTHLIAARLGTAKVNEARRLKSPGIKIVTPDWLWCCAERWEHIDERLFPLEKKTPGMTSINKQDHAPDLHIASVFAWRVPQCCCQYCLVTTKVTVTAITQNSKRYQSLSIAVTLRPPAHCSSPEIAFAERCNEVNLQRQNSGDSLPESNNPFLAMSSADLKGMEDEVDASSDSTSSSADSDEVET